ncbi:MAG TPA: sigma-54 dependent transcriptional regulator [Terriglobia bacterium]|nr:sigma-54 dependent transcriptional regulator [Terriglobia bacterium]
MSDTGALVYVVDDDVSAREGVAGLIRSVGLNTKTFASGQEFLASPRPQVPSCLVLDVNLPGLSGLDVQRELAKSGGQIPIIFLTGHGDIPMTVRAVKAGAVDFLTKPFDDEDLLKAVRQCLPLGSREEIRSEMSQVDNRVAMAAENTLAYGRLQDQRLYLESEISSECNFEDIVGKSAALRKVLDQVAIVAPTGSTVLLHGETGTGKELFARAIHNRSPRRERTFVRLNCAAIPSGLVESELFGHEKGAFTGALMQKKGRFELADGGSLFLDEIGDISLDLQPKLLRALQEQEFERLGSTRTIQVDVRLIAATHRDLQDMMQNNQFREDLFYRLNVFPVEIPPLRERREDIPLLVHYFVSRLSRRMQKRIRTIPKEAMEALVSAPWPGNVRELENFIERCVIVTQGDNLKVASPELKQSVPRTAVPASTFEEAERQVIVDALKAASGKIAGNSGAAQRLGLKRSTLQNKMRKLNISRADYMTRSINPLQAT